MKAFTYFNPLTGGGGIWKKTEQLKLIKLWEKSWKKHGWDPIVLRESDAMKHPRYAEFKRVFWTLPTEYGHDYEGQCFLRYAAVSIQKQPMSLMLDYDVINYGFTPEDARSAAGKYSDPRLIFFTGPGVYSCGMTLGPWELFEGFAAICAAWKPNKGDWIKSATFEGYHCSDNSMLVNMNDGKGRQPCPAWLSLDRSGPNRVWSHPGWEVAKTVHYGFEMNRSGNWPKWKHIEKLRPI